MNSITPKTEANILDENVNKVLMMDSNNGWALLNDGSLLFTDDLWKIYKEVNRFYFDIESSTTTYVDGALYIIGFSSQKENIMTLVSKDNGVTFTESDFDYSSEDYGQGQLFSSFIDSQNGYLLYCGEPAAGLMPKILYKTSDGGKTYQKLEDVSYINGYPTGVTFNTSGEGFISS